MLTHGNYIYGFHFTKKPESDIMSTVSLFSIWAATSLHGGYVRGGGAIDLDFYQHCSKAMVTNGVIAEAGETIFSVMVTVGGRACGNEPELREETKIFNISHRILHDCFNSAK